MRTRAAGALYHDRIRPPGAGASVRRPIPAVTGTFSPRLPSRMARPLVAHIDLAALAKNLARVRALAPGAQVLAVVKADAYGHGLARALPALAQADGLALIEL